MYIVAQILGFIAFLVSLYAYQRVNKKRYTFMYGYIKSNKFSSLFNAWCI